MASPPNRFKFIGGNDFVSFSLQREFYGFQFVINNLAKGIAEKGSQRSEIDDTNIL